MVGESDRASDRAVLVVHELVGGTTALDDALGALAALAADAVGADLAGLTLTTPGGRPRTAVHTDAIVAEIDRQQDEHDRGPGLEALRTGTTVLIPDVREEHRWPEFAAAAARHGVCTTLSVPLLVGGRGVGVLTFYARALDHFDATRTAVATRFARHAAVVAAYAERAEQAESLQRAMESRATIEQAKGIIMATAGCSADDAFVLLRQQSQIENRKLRDIAAELVELQRRPPP